MSRPTINMQLKLTVGNLTSKQKQPNIYIFDFLNVLVLIFG